MLRDSKTLGIVIKTENVREKDRLISILTPDDGVIPVLVYGAQQSRKACNASLYSEGIFSLYQKKEKGQYSLKDADIITAHEYILEDLDKIAVSALFSEIVIKSCSTESAVYKLFTSSIDSLESCDYKKTAVAFILKFLDISGLIGDYAACPACGRAYSRDEVLGFSASSSVAVCLNCDTMGKQMILPPNARAYIARTLELPLSDALRLGVSDAQLGRIFRYVLRTLEYCFPAALETIHSGLMFG